MKVFTLFLLGAVFCAVSVHSRETKKQESHAGLKSERKNNPYGFSEKDVKWIPEATQQQLEGCRVQGAGGVWIHTPDGVGNYKSLWTRDSYYMVEYAGDLMSREDIKASILPGYCPFTI